MHGEDPLVGLGLSNRGIVTLLVVIGCVAVLWLGVWLAVRFLGRAQPRPIPTADAPNRVPTPAEELWELVLARLKPDVWYYTNDDYYIRVVVTGGTTRQIERAAGSEFVDRTAGATLELEVIVVEGGDHYSTRRCRARVAVTEQNGSLLVAQAQPQRTYQLSAHDVQRLRGQIVNAMLT